MVDQLSANIRDGAGLRDASGIRSVADISSSSLEAQRLYVLGSDAAMNLRLDEAQRALEQAVAIDPGFVAAYMRLGFVYASTGQTAARKAALQKALAHVDRLSDRDRLRVRLTTGLENGNTADAAEAL